MSTTFPQTRLPNRINVFFLKEEEVSILYEQVQEYIKHGIQLNSGDTVFDVGANIGLFTLWIDQKYNKDINIYAFEPIPAIFAVLEANAQCFNPEKIKVFPCGLSRESKSVTFAYHPNATMLSSAHQDSLLESRQQLKQTMLRNLKDAPISFRWLRFLPKFLRSIFLDMRLEKAFQVEQVSCQLTTVSAIIREFDIDQIDLLKVDVEKSELDVFLGIEDQHWSKIKQVVVEVHDLDHRLEKIMGLLKEHGLTEITVEQEPLFKDSNIFNLYALRQK